MLKRIFYYLALVLLSSEAMGQTSTSFDVGGDLDKFYPVVFNDAEWDIGKATVLHIGRSDVHRNSEWRGALIAKFQYHTTNWGHGAAFIDAEIRSSKQPFIAGWTDATSQNGDKRIVIWLRGGATTYFLNSDVTISFQVYDGAQLPLPFNELNGPAHTFKTVVDGYVKEYATRISNPLYVASDFYVDGNVGIGTATPAEKLSVNGKIRAKEIKVEANNWPDYVFEEDHKPMLLTELEAYIRVNKHLPEIPSAKEAEANGISLGEMNKLLLKKIEELTLLLIEQGKTNKQQATQIKKLQTQMKNKG